MEEQTCWNAEMQMLRACVRMDSVHFDYCKIFNPLFSEQSEIIRSFQSDQYIFTWNILYSQKYKKKSRGIDYISLNSIRFNSNRSKYEKKAQKYFTIYFTIYFYMWNMS